MDILLVSEDRELYRLSLEILDEILSQPWTLSVASAEEAAAYADVCIWDYQPGSAPATGPRAAQHLYLVSRRDLPEFRSHAAVAEANVLLKPVTPVMLAAFLGFAVSSRGSQPLREDRDQILQCLVETNLTLQEYDQDRTNFLARAVHDFRAPLTALGGYCGLLLDESFGPVSDQQRDVLRRMRRSAHRLSRMAAAMFQLSISRRLKKRPNLERADLQESLDQALHEIAPFADEQRIAITTDLEPGDEDLLFEPGQIEQVLVNILDNACKFTPKSGAIAIHGYPYFWERRSGRSATTPVAERRRQPNRAPNSYRIDIEDSGAPIPPEHLEKIFEEYASYAGTRDRSGGGLGLAICRLIVTQHGGRIWAENTDSGPRFSIVLPLDRGDSPLRAEEEEIALEEIRRINIHAVV